MWTQAWVPRNSSGGMLMEHRMFEYGNPGKTYRVRCPTSSHLALEDVLITRIVYIGLLYAMESGGSRSKAKRTGVSRRHPLSPSMEVLCMTVEGSRILSEHAHFHAPKTLWNVDTGDSSVQQHVSGSLRSYTVLSPSFSMK